VRPPILLVREPIAPEDLARAVDAWFGDMVKLVVDVRLELAAVGGELHADAEALLLESGSRQQDLWGANYYPGLGERALEFTALINIRPAQGNRGMEIQDPAIRERVRGIATRLIGSGGSLA
jgi:hypothetical protein